MDAKRYCKLVVVVTLVALAVVAVFNLLVDPLGAYPSVGLRAFERQRHTHFGRMARAELARRGHWEAVILGTSRPKAGMPAEHPAFATHRACNLAVDAARMSEAAAMFEFTRAHNPLRHVVLCLDLAMFRDSTFYQFDFPESRFNTNLSLFEYHCKNLIGANISDQSFDSFTETLRGRLPPEGERDGFHVRDLKRGTSQRALFNKSLRALAYGYAVQHPARREMEALRRVIASSRDHGVALTLAINPVHALDLELLHAGGAWPRFEQWKRDVVGMVDELAATNVVVWDFSGYWTATTEEVPPAGDTETRMKLYYENSHYTPAMGALMLDRMFLGATNVFGATISTKSIEQHLERIREQRVAYVRAHAAEIDWVNRISKEALAARQRTANAGDEAE